MTTDTATDHERVTGRVTRLLHSPDVRVATLGLLVAVVAAATLLFLQEPGVHETFHEFRHVSGVPCN